MGNRTRSDAGKQAAFSLRGKIALAGAIIAAAIAAAYANTLRAPFFFDDRPAILENPSIRHLSALGRVLSPPAADGSGVAGRPIVNLSLAFDYAIGELNVVPYHLTNLAIHLGAALALFGIARRTFARRGAPGPGLFPGFVLALLWAVHPLLTESVTCVIQRTESLMGLFYLLTLYGFVRAAESPSPPRWWYAVSVLSCALGMGTKEVMVSAPLMVWLYDRTFVAGTFAQAWRARRRYYLALAATWIVLAAIEAGMHGGRSSAAGFGHGVSAWDYALTQCKALALYLKLAIWPHPLVVDYGTAVVTRPGAVLLQGLLVCALLVATMVALGRRPQLGFLGAWCFCILAPSSSFIPLVTQTIAEHRMYLPLAALLALPVAGVNAAGGGRAVRWLALLALPLAAATFARNRDYRTVTGIWRSVAARVPENARAHYSIARAAFDEGDDLDLEIREYREAIRLKPDYYEALQNLAAAVARRSGGQAEALEDYEKSLAIHPASPEAQYDYALELAKIPGRRPAALAHLRAAVRYKPDFTLARLELAAELAREPGGEPEARRQIQEAVRLAPPDDAQAHDNLGVILGRDPATRTEAEREFRTALRLRPDDPQAHYNYGNLLTQLAGRMPDAIAQFREAIRELPGYALAENNLASALASQPGGLPEAIRHYQRAIAINPKYAEAENNLAVAYYRSGDRARAIEHFHQALAIDPSLDSVRANLKRLEP